MSRLSETQAHDLTARFVKSRSDFYNLSALADRKSTPQGKEIAVHRFASRLITSFSMAVTGAQVTRSLVTYVTSQTPSWMRPVTYTGNDKLANTASEIGTALAFLQSIRRGPSLPFSLKKYIRRFPVVFGSMFFALLWIAYVFSTNRTSLSFQALMMEAVPTALAISLLTAFVGTFIYAGPGLDFKDPRLQPAYRAILLHDLDCARSLKQILNTPENLKVLGAQLKYQIDILSNLVNALTQILLSGGVLITSFLLLTGDKEIQRLNLRWAIISVLLSIVIRLSVLRAVAKLRIWQSVTEQALQLTDEQTALMNPAQDACLAAHTLDGVAP